MLIGVPNETKVEEHRVGLTPASVRELTQRGHRVLVETTAGRGVGAGDADYALAGAEIAPDAAAVFAAAEMIVKVKEPLAAERARLRPGQVLFTYLHLAADEVLTSELLASGATCIAYETVIDGRGALPLLAPMSEIAGRMSVQAAAHSLETAQGGLGALLGGAAGVEPCRVVILGGGVVGANAAAMALGLGADVTVVDRSVSVLAGLTARFSGAVRTAFSTQETLNRLIPAADVVIIGVLQAGAAAARLVTADHVRAMKTGSVLVDVAIDQGGGAETSRPTTHLDPTFKFDGVVHYCVANMPGGVARTATAALNNATLPYVLRLADLGVEAALGADPGFAAGLSLWQGRLTNIAVGDHLGLAAVTPSAALAA